MRTKDSSKEEYHLGMIGNVSYKKLVTSCNSSPSFSHGLEICFVSRKVFLETCFYCFMASLNTSVGLIVY